MLTLGTNQESSAGKDVQRLKTGLNWFQSIPERDRNAVLVTIYRVYIFC